ncbi:MAG TPA: hypothetical protein VGL06_23930, partial [Pseudonocardiaceae bacterium]
ATANTTGLVVTKEVCRSPNPVDCAAGGAGPWAGTATVAAGWSAYWRISVTNVGSLDLTGVTLADDAEPSCAAAAGGFDLAAGATTQFYCATTNLTKGMTNAVTATFTPPDFPPVTTSPSAASVSVADLTVHKEVCLSSRPADCAAGGDGPWADSATIPTGFQAFWRITVTNAGEVDLTGISLADKGQPDCADTGFDLAAGASRTLYCVTPDVMADVTNTASATYPLPDAPPDTPQVGTPKSSATAHVSDLIVTKEVCQSPRRADCGPDGDGTWGKVMTIQPGATAYWRITVTNDSDVRVNGISLRDVVQRSCVPPVPFSLDAGEFQRLYCATRNVTADLTNTALARYLRPGDAPPVTVSTPPDSAAVRVARLTVTKHVCAAPVAADCGPGGAGRWADELRVPSGATAYWRITVENVGTVDVTATVRDPAEPSCEAAAGILDLRAGTSRDVFCATANVTGSRRNVALAAFRPVGADPDTPPTLTDPASARVLVPRPEMIPPIAPASASTPLAWTGATVLPLAALGLTTLFAGAGLMRLARRRS